ncbi:MAG: toprim domain-containing protein [Oscillospiraceae bacterium]|nr:toprim domain-containing protein [Oscillospiraceae bacterium]
MKMTRDQAKIHLKGFLGDYLARMGWNTHDGRKNMRCPNAAAHWHGDKNESAKFYPRTQTLFCFACGKPFDIFDCVGMLEGVEGYDAQLLRLCQLYGIELVAPRSTAAQDFAAFIPAPAAPAQVEEPAEDFSEYFEICQRRLMDTDYHRGISVETLKRFRVGFDPEWRQPKKPGSPASPRLIIPISNIGYLARATDGRTEYSKMKAGKMGLFNSAALHESEKPIFVVEGELDALSIIDAGGEAVALGSTSMVSRFLDALYKAPPAVPLILALDADEAGKKAADKIAAEAPPSLSLYRHHESIWGEHKDANAALMADPSTFAAQVRAVESAAGAAVDPWSERSVSWYIDNSFASEVAAFKKHAYRKTGFSNLDKILNALYPGLYVVGAISALGKTTFIHQLCDQMAATGEHILFFSLEMSRLELVAKSVARRATQKAGKSAYIGALKIRAGSLSPDEYELVESVKKEMSGSLQHFRVIEGGFRQPVESICADVREYCKRYKVSPVVVVDYLQVLPNSSEGTEREGVNHNVEALKLLSRDCNCPVIVISAFNRANYTVPVSYESFKESGGIEYTADVVMGLQVAEMSRDKSFDSSDPSKRGTRQAKIREAIKAIPREIELCVLKNRNGRSNQSCFFRYFPHMDIFEEAEDIAPAGREALTATADEKYSPPAEAPQEELISLADWLPTAAEVAEAEYMPQ